MCASLFLLPLLIYYCINILYYYWYEVGMLKVPEATVRVVTNENQYFEIRNLGN